VNVSGSTPVFDASDMQKWQTTEVDAQKCFGFSEACVMLVRELPAIRNKPARANAVKKYVASKLKSNLGNDLNEYAKNLSRPDFDVPTQSAAADAAKD
jgi:hypothetical protein